MKAFLLLFFMLFFTAWPKSAEEWRSRTIYQILTDRFARTDGQTPHCENLKDYCGGTFKGIEQNLDYIQELGVDAIWISPVAENAPGGYHGYWLTNFYEFNLHFGTRQDFLDLLDACHKRDIWVIVDVVANHVAHVPNDNGTNYDFTGVVPFNDLKYYHWPPCPMCQYIDKNDPKNQTALEHCWLSNLPDLNHEDPYVTEVLVEGIKDFTETYPVDGLRLDAVRHVPKWFWRKFSKAAGVFTLGEIWNPDVEYCAAYQEVIDSLLNFPFRLLLEKVFNEEKSMTLFQEYYLESVKDWRDITILGNFVANQDLARFLHNSDPSTYKAIYAYVLTSMGIPIIYYGDEQSFSGGDDPENREPLWAKMNTNSEMFQYIKTILSFKKESQYHNFEQLQSFADDTFYAFTRGESFFAFSNSDQRQSRIIKRHPYVEGTDLCSIFNQKECIQVVNGEFEVTIINKIPQILAPRRSLDSASIKESMLKGVIKIWSNIFVQDSSKATSLKI